MFKYNLLILIIVVSFLSSCKKCDPSNSTSGIIIEKSRVKVLSGHAGQQFITDTEQYPGIEMSLDDGKTYTSVDFSKYSVMGLTTTAGCSTGYARNVQVNDAAKTVTYTITLSECPTCKNSVTIDNWVLIKKVPSNYSPIFDIKKK